MTIQIQNKTYSDLGKDLSKTILNKVWELKPTFDLIHEELRENPSNVTIQEVIDKIRAFLAQDPDEIKQAIFLHYLAYYPVSMCKREVSPMLKVLIGFHYQMCIPTEKDVKDGIEKVSYDDLSQIFVRSKATISVCVNETQGHWRDFIEEIEKDKRLENEARQLLIEQKAEQLRNTEGMNEGTNK